MDNCLEPPAVQDLGYTTEKNVTPDMKIPEWNSGNCKDCDMALFFGGGIYGSLTERYYCRACAIKEGVLW